MPPSFVSPPVAGSGRPLGSLLGLALRRPGGRRGVSVLSIVLLLAGVAMFAYPLATDLWSRFRQGELQGTASSPEAAAAYRERRVPVGAGLTTLRLPKIDVSVLVVEGTTPSALRAGAGHYVDTPLPGEPGNVAIAGHRTTYGRPFNRLDEMGPGDIAELETPFQIFTYRAVEPFAGHANPWVVVPTDYGVVGPEGVQRGLTLTTCHPKGSAAQRLIMRFELVGSRPLDRPAGA